MKLYAGIDLHSNNSVIDLLGEKDINTCLMNSQPDSQPSHRIKHKFSPLLLSQLSTGIG